MDIRPSDLQAIPLFRGITDAHLEELMRAFERLELPAEHVLFEAGSAPTHLLLLVRGEVSLREDGDVRFRLSPLAPIGELGALTGLSRRTTARTTQPSEIWRMSVAELMSFFEKHGDVAFPFHHNLLNVVADKVRRESRRLEETRANLVRTQKAMKALVEKVLETEETPLSRVVCETLENLVEHNRRVHYMVEPSPKLPCSLRLDDGHALGVRELSDTCLRVGSGPRFAPKVGDEVSGVLVLPGRELPVSGNVQAVEPDGALIGLDLLIDDYGAALGDYLTRVQMLEFVV